MATVAAPKSEASQVINQAAPRPPAEPRQQGLTSDEAKTDLQKLGLNSMPDTTAHPLRRAVTKLWAPVPWMLEAAIVLELLLHKFAEGGIIFALLLFNAVLAYSRREKLRPRLLP